MQRPKFTNIISMGSLVILGIGLLTGCQEEREVDYVIDDIREETQAEENSTISGKTNVLQFADTAQWNEIWTMENEEGETVTVKTEADISIPESEYMSVVEVEVPEFNADYKERIARRIYGSETVYYHDFDHLPKKELEEMYAYYEEWYDSAFDQEVKDGLKENMEECEAALENAKDTYTQVERYDANQYVGKYNGNMFLLEFHILNDVSMGMGKSYSQWINFYAMDNDTICPEAYDGYTSYMEHPYVNSEKYKDIAENECSLSEQEAEKMARQFLESLGMEYPVLAYSKPLLWGDDTLSSDNCYDCPANGYVFQYEYGLDNVSFPSYGDEWEYDSRANYSGEDDEVQYSMCAQANIYVTEQGVIQMLVNNPVETTGVTERVELLPLDTIQEIMKEEIKTQYENDIVFIVTGNEVMFTNMELIYFRVSDKSNSGHYSYIPAWRLSGQIGARELGNRSIRNPVIINAIDGSVIHLYDET